MQTPCKQFDAWLNHPHSDRSFVLSEVVKIIGCRVPFIKSLTRTQMNGRPPLFVPHKPGVGTGNPDLFSWKDLCILTCLYEARKLKLDRKMVLDILQGSFDRDASRQVINVYREHCGFSLDVPQILRELELRVCLKFSDR